MMLLPPFGVYQAVLVSPHVRIIANSPIPSVDQVDGLQGVGKRQSRDLLLVLLRSHRKTTTTIFL